MTYHIIMHTDDKTRIDTFQVGFLEHSNKDNVFESVFHSIKEFATQHEALAFRHAMETDANGPT